MNAADIVILLVLAALFALSIRHSRRRAKTGCCGSCSGCGTGCAACGERRP